MDTLSTIITIYDIYGNYSAHIRCSKEIYGSSTLSHRY